MQIITTEFCNKFEVKTRQIHTYDIDICYQALKWEPHFLQSFLYFFPHSQFCYFGYLLFSFLV
jgi:hypothetical protein